MHVICICLVGNHVKYLDVKSVFVGRVPSRKCCLMDAAFQDISKIVYALMLKDSASNKIFTSNQTTIDKCWIVKGV